MRHRPAITPEEFATWVIPGDALDRLTGHVLAHMATGQIVLRLRCGHLRAIARRATQNRHNYEFFEIPPELWKLTDGDVTFPLWSTGDLTIPDDPAKTSLFSVRFDPVGLAEFALPLDPGRSSLPLQNSLPSPVEMPVPMVERKGRPPKEWWDDLWVEMCRKIYEDGFAPKIQADIERAMLDWAVANDHEMSEITARRAARKLFPIFRDEG